MILYLSTHSCIATKSVVTKSIEFRTKARSSWDKCRRPPSTLADVVRKCKFSIELPKLNPLCASSNR